MEGEEGTVELDELYLGCLGLFYYYYSTLWILKYMLGVYS
jgi:hypothetical protein